MNTCIICNRRGNTFSLVVPAEEPLLEGDTYSVCGRCWDAISQIAFLRIQAELEEMRMALAALQSSADMQESVAIWGQGGVR